MLFNSYSFLFLFLPVVLAGSYALASRDARLAAGWLVAASLFFYGWWDPRFVLLLAASIVFNYLAAEAIVRSAASGKPLRLLWCAIGVDLALLGYFKYANFFVANVSTLLGSAMRIEEIVLPLGISFFTFTQIAYLVDVYRDPVRYRFVHYALFVSYFPHLIAGPILHHREVIPQFEAGTAFRLDYANLAAGLTLFALGLCKKTLLADGIAPYASPVFDAAPGGYAPGTLEAWGAALAFGLQLYFDFSAYSDMAVGLSAMLGIRLPANFESPYKAASVIEFWRRWHITLSRFLRNYLYIALGGNRRGTIRRYTNLMITMVLGGLWHGAAWTFVLWGAAHGVLLMINHGWRALRGRFRRGPSWLAGIEGAFGFLLTFIAIFSAWVLFRAHDLPSAWSILRGMAGLNGNAIPPDWLTGIADVARWIAGSDVLPFSIRNWVRTNLGNVDAGVPRGLGQGRAGGVLISGAQLLWIAGLLAIAWFMPNTRQIMAGANVFIAGRAAPAAAAALRWRVDRGWSIATGLLLVAALTSMTRVSEFLYFRF